VTRKSSLSGHFSLYSKVPLNST